MKCAAWILNARFALVCIAIVAASGCETYEKDVGYRPFFSGLEGVETQADAGSATGGGPSRPVGYQDPTAAGSELRLEADDGTITLRALTGRHLMRHIFETLRDGERDLFTEQVLSKATQEEFRRNNQPPEAAFDMLERALPDIDKLFARMPMGEYTPNVQLQPMGQGLNRVRLVRGIGRDLRWQGFDMIMEGGNQRLLWFYDERR